MEETNKSRRALILLKKYAKKRKILNQDDIKDLEEIDIMNLGDIKGRFILSDHENALVYDRLLEGYWSKISKQSYNIYDTLQYQDELNGCPTDKHSAKLWKIRERISAKGEWQIANIYQLTSLATKKWSIKDNGYIHPIFDSPESSINTLWSSNSVCKEKSWAFLYETGSLILINSNRLFVRCFKHKVR